MGLFSMHRGRGLGVVLAALALMLPGIARAQSPEVMPVSQVKPGMKGYGLTVFKGTKIEKFDVEVIGILKKQNTGGDLILVKMSGGPITQRGANIIAGMSGSPVYINGKVVGAVAYGMSYPKEPFAMLTPMQDMLEALDPKLDKLPPIELTPVYEPDKPLRIGDRVIDKITLGHAGQTSTSASAMEMVPLAMPMMVSGVSPRCLRLMKESFGSAGIEPMAGPGSASVAGDIPLLPGSAIGVQYMRGDIEMTGIGTVTWRKGNKILAFGHPMMGVGPSDFPMTTAVIHDIYPSIMSSFKLGSPVRLVGSITQDRPWAVAGAVGRMPTMVPLTITVRDLGNGREKTLNVEVMNHRLLTPTLMMMAANEGVFEMHPSASEAMARVKVEIATESFPSIVRDNVFFDATAIDMTAIRELGTLMAILTQNPQQVEKIKRISLKVDIWDKRQTATVQRVFLNKSKFEPGETVEAGVVLKPYKQDEVTRTLSVKIPETAANGSVSLLISGGGASGQIVVSAADPAVSNNPLAGVVPSPVGGVSGMELKEMVKRFLERDKNNDLVAKLVLSGPGYNIRGEKMLSIPSNLAEVFRSPKATGLRTEHEEIKTILPTEWVVSGSQQISVTVQRKTKSEKASDSRSDSSPSPPVSTSIISDPTAIFFDSGDEMSARGSGQVAEVAPGRKADEEPKADAKKDAVPAEDKKADAKTEEKKADAKATEKTPADSGASSASTTAKTVVRQAAKWSVTDQADFEQGSGAGTAATSVGDLRLTRSMKRLYDSPEPYIWSLATAPGGVYAGTGNGGRIYKIDSAGKEKLFAETGALEVLALAGGGEGALYASVFPGAAIDRIGADGKVTKLYEAKERYILAMVADGAGNLYAATGGGVGRVYRIGPGGAAELILQTTEAHVQSLAIGPDGSLYAGTGDNGLIYRIAPDGVAKVLYDTSETSVTALALDAKGNLYAGTGTGAKGVLYRIGPDGTVKKLFDKFKSSVSAVVTDSAGNALAASGSQVYCVSPDDTVIAFDEVPGAQFQALALDAAGTLYAGTVNTGAIYVNGAGGVKAVYESSTHDAGSIAQWGRILWNAAAVDGTAVSVQTRSGNSAEPDAGWSGWSQALMSGDPIPSPPARFIQFRAALSSDRADQTPRLRDVVVSYLPRNQAPTVSISAPAAGAYWSKTQSIKWTATDPDKDTITTEISCSADNGKTWKLLKSIDKESSYSWDTSTVADGTYLLKVAVSDRKSNPTGALGAEKLSDPVVVCNKAPTVTITHEKDLPVAADKTVAVAGRAFSQSAPIVGVEWQVNGNGWSAAIPEDGIYDSEHEGFSFTTEPLPAGSNNLEVRATDAAGNSTTQKVVVKVK